MRLKQAPQRLAMLVGSIPAPTARQAREQVLKHPALARNLLALTDGETDEGASQDAINQPISSEDGELRSKWLVGQLRAWVGSEALEPIDSSQAAVGYGGVTYDNMVTFRKKRGLKRRLRASDLPLGVADHARRAWEQHHQDCPDLLLQVGIPTWVNYLLFGFGLDNAWKPQYIRAIRGAVKREMREIFRDDPAKGLKGVPRDRVVIQVEDPGGFCITAGAPQIIKDRFPRLAGVLQQRWMRWMLAQIMAVIVWGQARWAPRGTAVATHGCLGDLERIRYGAFNLEEAVPWYHNALVRWRWLKLWGRPWVWSHWPVASGQDLPPEPTVLARIARRVKFLKGLYVVMGMIVPEDTAPAVQARAQAVVQAVAPRFRRWIAFAMPCGGGRQTPEEFDRACELIEVALQTEG